MARQWVDGRRFVNNQLVAMSTANPDEIFTQQSLRYNFVNDTSPLVVNNEWLSVNVPYALRYSALDDFLCARITKKIHKKKGTPFTLKQHPASGTSLSITFTKKKWGQFRAHS